MAPDSATTRLAALFAALEQRVQQLESQSFLAPASQVRHKLQNVQALATGVGDMLDVTDRAVADLSRRVDRIEERRDRGAKVLVALIAAVGGVLGAAVTKLAW